MNLLNKKGVTFKCAFPNYEIWKTIKGVDAILFEEEIYLLLLNIFGNRYMVEMSYDDLLGYVGLIYNEAIYFYNISRGLYDKTLDDMLLGNVTSEGDVYNPKNIKKDKLSEAYLMAYQVSNLKTRANYLSTIEDMRKLLKSSKSEFINKMREILSQIQTVNITKGGHHGWL